MLDMKYQMHSHSCPFSFHYTVPRFGTTQHAEAQQKPSLLIKPHHAMVEANLKCPLTSVKDLNPTVMTVMQ